MDAVDLVGLSSSTPLDTYTLIDGLTMVDTPNLGNFGPGNVLGLGGAKFAYFIQVSLILNVVPEPSTYGLALGGLALSLLPADIPGVSPEHAPMLLTPAQIDEALRSLPGWTTNGKALFRTYTFADFPAAVAFVNQLVAPAEVRNHHPDISLSFNRVSLSLTTHDAGGLTAKDLALARALAV